MNSNETTQVETDSENIIDSYVYNPDEKWFQPDDMTKIEAKQVSRQLECDEIIATRLVMIGKQAQEIGEYLDPSPQEIIHPEITVPGMKNAAEALLCDLTEGKAVALYGDYDVDGQTSMAILSDTMTRLGGRVITGQANAQTGFGLNREFVESAAEENAAWLITVDCGSTQSEPITLAQELGMQVIVIDHHDVDINNPAEHHLNPRLLAAVAATEIVEALDASTCSQSFACAAPYDLLYDRLTDRSKDILNEWFGSDHFDEIEQNIKNFSHPSNTGSILTWKFACSLWIAKDGKAPKWLYGQPLYLAGLGAIADLAPCDDQEIRAFVRCSTDSLLQRRVFKNHNHIPMGVEMLAEALGEDATRPDTLIRTRALCNLPKRTTEINPADIQTIFTSQDYNQLHSLIPSLVENYERLSSIRRDEMDVIALEQMTTKISAETEGNESYFAHAVLDGFDAYAGYTRMVANTLVKNTGRPSIAFACKGEDEFGQKLYKWSGANGVVPGVKLGELISDENMRAACKIRMRVWEGTESYVENIGGHTEVVSGVCTEENIEAVMEAAENWARRHDEKKNWYSLADRKRPRVVSRLVSARRFRRLEREANMLAPFAFPHNPLPQVSVKAQFSNFSRHEATNILQATMTLEDGTQRAVCIAEKHEQTVMENPELSWEAIIALGGTNDYFIGQLHLIETN